MASGSQTQDRPYAHLISQNPTRKNIELRKKVTVFGRDPSCDACFSEDPRFSGRHFAITKDDDDIVIEDTSMNGTFVNGTMLGKGNRMKLKNSDSISLLSDSPQRVDELLSKCYVAYILKVLDGTSRVAVIDNKEFEADYDIVGDCLGEGAFATVWLSVHKESHKRYATKMIKKISGADRRKEKSEERLRAEVEILKKVHHQNIVSLFAVYDTPKFLYLVMDYAEGGELFDRIVSLTSYSEVDARDCTRQILSAVAYLHSQQIVHRDLKPENILLIDKKSNTNIKITDFGLSRLLGDQSVMHTVCGTLQYCAPETLLAGGGVTAYTDKVDEWAIGVILYILLCGFPPFHDGKSKTVHKQILDGDYEFEDEYWSEISPEAKDLVSKFLTHDPIARLSCERALQHPWFGLSDSARTMSRTLSVVSNLRHSFQQGMLLSSFSYGTTDMIGEHIKYSESSPKRARTDNP
eukprot:TRINITY_DN20015_c0_g1_i1.p1 TRINITY_DN20015_c0_g1~~TRINITY_DN20015_c0_g1_i1.p1  ORF type:complete len:465 (-),score=102.96 TRINITY_DN20015_c0_g1_i1:67-1461(-)